MNNKYTVLLLLVAVLAIFGYVVFTQFMNQPLPDNTFSEANTYINAEGASVMLIPAADQNSVSLTGLGFDNVMLTLTSTSSGLHFENPEAKLAASKIDGELTIYRGTELMFTGRLATATGPTPVPTPAPEEKSDVDNALYLKQLTENTWVWTKTVMSDDSIVTPKSASAFTVTYASDGSISGTTDCNGFSGSYTLTGNTLSLSPLARTLMYCDNSQEGEFVDMVTKAQTIFFTESADLVLLLPNDSGTVVFSKKKLTPPIATKPPQAVTRGCYVGGCSSQLCSDTPDMASTCEWKEEYACYKNATCERQASGVCGWTETSELRQCLTAGGEQSGTPLQVW